MIIKEIVNIQKNNNSIAIIQGEKSITYNKLINQATKIASVLNKMHYLSPLVIICIPNCIDFFTTYLAFGINKMVIFPIHYRENTQRIFDYANFTNAEFILIDKKYHSLSDDIYTEYETIDLDFLDTSSITLLVKKNPKQGVFRESTFLMLNTSGSSDNPKIVLLSHDNIRSNVYSCIDKANIQRNEIGFIIMPLSSAYAHTEQFLAYLLRGVKIILLSSFFNPTEFFKLVQTQKVTRFECVPTMLSILLNYRYKDRYDISSLKHIGVGGGPVSKSLLENGMAFFKNSYIIQSYGLTEASPLVTIMDRENIRKKITSVGKPIDNTIIKIERLHKNSIHGEVYIKGPGVMSGYYMCDNNKNIISGWLRTGDLGYVDNDGYLYITGRKSNQIKCNGFRISPEEVEEVILLHPQIKEALVTCINKNGMDILKAEIVTADSKKISLNTIKLLCKKHLANYKIPTIILIVREIPKTLNGKIKR